MKKTKQFTQWMKGNIHLFFIGFIFMIIVQYLRSITPLFVQHIVDHIFGGEASALPGIITRYLGGTTVQEKLLLVAIISIVVTLIRLIFVFLNRIAFATFMENIAYRMRNTLYNHIQNLSFRYHSKADTGDLIQRTTTDVDTYRRFIGEQLVDVSRLFFLVGFAIFQMAMMSGIMTLISLAMAPIIFVSGSIYFVRVKAVFDRVEQAEAKMTTAVQENVTGSRVVKAFHNEKFEIKKFDEASLTFREESMHLTRLMALFWSSTDFIIFMQYTLTASFGIYFTVMGAMRPGQFIAFLTLLGMVVWPLRQLGRIIGDFGKTSVALERIEDIMKHRSEHEGDSQNTPKILGHVQFKDVGFQFDDDTKPLLSHINFDIKPGETLAIIGKTGSGKSTLMNLMVRLLEPTSGTILYDGNDIQSINKKHLRKHVGIILQEPFLYSKTVF